MSNLFTRLVQVTAAGALLLATGAACAKSQSPDPVAQSPAATPTTTLEATPTEDPESEPQPQPTKNQPPKPSTSSWPSPSDCFSYNPNNLTVFYDAVSDKYNVMDGGNLVLQLFGDEGEKVGEQGLALAKRYRKLCFIGRDNTRSDERGAYIFDYWRDPSGMKPTIPDLEDACSSYDNNNLTVEDMGSGYGWRVKDHDHVLHLFDNEKDARNGKLVLAKYKKICEIGHSNDDGNFYVSFNL